MKKRVLFIFVVILLLFSSCGRYGYYRGKYPYLFTQTTSSLLGTGSYDPHIQETIYVIETDEYGRELFLAIDGADLLGSIAIMGICQKNDKENVYYYPEINFIQKSSLVGSYLVEEGNYVEDCINQHFTENEIEQLKEKNDWNIPFLEEKCIKKSIYRIKPEIIDREDVIEVFKNEDNLESISKSGYYIDACFLTNDLNDNSIYTVTVIDNDDNVKSYLLCFDKNKNLKKDSGIEEVEDFLDYSQQLKNFKEKNGFIER